MTREDALAMYHPIRASVRRILSAAFRVCNQADLMRAAKQKAAFAWPVSFLDLNCRWWISPLPKSRFGDQAFDFGSSLRVKKEDCEVVS